MGGGSRRGLDARRSRRLVVLAQNDAAGPPTVTSLTTYNGPETQPSLSPDGAQVAFVWTGEQQDNSDIYVKPVDAVTPLRLTSDPLTDLSAGMVAVRPGNRVCAVAG